MMKSKALLSTWIKRFEFIYLEFIYLEFEIIITRWFHLRQHVCLNIKKSRDVNTLLQLVDQRINIK